MKYFDITFMKRLRRSPTVKRIVIMSSAGSIIEPKDSPYLFTEVCRSSLGCLHMIFLMMDSGFTERLEQL